MRIENLDSIDDDFRESLGARGRRAPWFLGDAPAPPDEPTEAAGQASMSTELQRLPFLRVAHDLMGWIRDGRRLTARGELFAVDRRSLERSSADVTAEVTWSPYESDSWTRFVWDMLIAAGWLLREDRWVRPSEVAPASAGRAPAPERDSETCRRLFAVALEAAIDRTPFALSAGADEDILQALLVASGHEGLTLPDHLVDGAHVHCCEVERFLAELVRHPHIREAPINRSTGHPDVGELGRLASVSEAMDVLVRRGLVTVERGVDAFDVPTPRRYRAPVAVRGVVAWLRKERSETAAF